jgi:ribosomal-protein-alanine N-acetyltransferase
VAWFILDEVHLGNLAVHPDHRRQGIARALVEHLVERARRRGSSFITLEVRAGNRAAIDLYARHRFQPVGLRKGYYAGREDAIVMVRELTPGQAAAGEGRDRADRAVSEDGKR